MKKPRAIEAISGVSVSIGTRAADAKETEITGFILKGRKRFEKLRIEDLDVIVTKTGDKLIPLIRLAESLKIKINFEHNRISFQTESNKDVALNIENKQITVNGTVVSSEAHFSISEITGQQEIYLYPADVADIFSFEIHWSAEDYAFTASTKARLNIWKRADIKSPFAIHTIEIPPNLPELFSTAYPRASSIDFIELKFRSKISLSNAQASDKVEFDSMWQTVWGNFFGGRYKIQASEPGLSWNNRDGTNSNDPAFVIDRANWTKRYGNTELVIGDSSFALNNITFPLVNIRGLRFNGLTGLSEDDRLRDRSALGLKPHFMQNRIFEGLAPLGSQVSLNINGRTVDTQEAFHEGATPPEMGVYRFEDINLPAGTLNDVQIIIIAPDGIKTVIQKDIVDSPFLLPRGRLAYAGGLGTAHHRNSWNTNGIIGGIRGLYGINERLTVGGTIAYQDGFSRSNSGSGLINASVPSNSIHIGTQATFLLSEQFLISMDSSFSNSHGLSYDAMAWLIKGDYYMENSLLQAMYFRYGPSFFNGNNPDLMDREGYAAWYKTKLHPQWSLNAGAAHVSDNLNAILPDTFVVDFQNLHISTSAIPATSLTFGADRVSANDMDSDQVLYSVDILIHPFQDLELAGSISEGDTISLNRHSDFMSGLNLPGIVTNRTTAAAASIYKRLNRNHSLRAAYHEQGNREKASLTHSYTDGNRPFTLRTEIGQNLHNNSAYIKGRSEYRLGPRKNKLLSLNVSAEDDDISAFLMFNYRELFSVSKGGISRIDSPGIKPDTGGVRGQVFLDINADGILNPGEEGVEDAKIIIDGIYDTVSDENGNYTLGGFRQFSESQVYLDLDSILAIYSASNGTQKAYISPGSLTEVNLGITPAHSLSGRVFSTADSIEKNIKGVRLYITKPDDNQVLRYSITGTDGRYYLEDIRPGSYLLHLDSKTLPEGYVAEQPVVPFIIKISPEPEDISITPHHIILSEISQNYDNKL